MFHFFGNYFRILLKYQTKNPQNLEKIIHTSAKRQTATVRKRQRERGTNREIEKRDREREREKDSETDREADRETD